MNDKWRLQMARRQLFHHDQVRLRARARRVQLKQLEKGAEMPECVVCWQEDTDEHMVDCGFGHAVCDLCLVAIAKEAELGFGQMPIPCAYLGCAAEYTRGGFVRSADD